MFLAYAFQFAKGRGINFKTSCTIIDYLQSRTRSFSYEMYVLPTTCRHNV